MRSISERQHVSRFFQNGNGYNGLNYPKPYIYVSLSHSIKSIYRLNRQVLLIDRAREKVEKALYIGDIVDSRDDVVVHRHFWDVVAYYVKFYCMYLVFGFDFLNLECVLMAVSFQRLNLPNESVINITMNGLICHLPRITFEKPVQHLVSSSPMDFNKNDDYFNRIHKYIQNDLKRFSII